MLRRAVILSLVAGALASMATPASATTIKTLAGAVVPSGASFAGSLKPNTGWHIEGGAAGDVDCSSSSLGGALKTNPDFPSVGASLTSLTAGGGCVDTIPFATLSIVTTNVGSGPNAKEAAATYVIPGPSSLLAIAGIEVTLTFSNGSACMYQPTGGTAIATHNSSTTPWNNEYLFNAVPLTKVGGTFAFCPSSNVTWTATYALTSGADGITIQSGGGSPAATTTLETLAGAAVPSNSTYSGSAISGTGWHLEGGTAGDIDCSTSTVAGTIATNPNTPSVTGNLTSLTLSSCTDTIPFVTVSSVTVNVGSGANAKTVTWTYAGSTSTWTWAGVEFTTTFSSGSTCIYQPTGGTATATHDSTTSPRNNRYEFNAVPTTRTGGTFGFCPSSGVTWSAAYGLTSSSSGITIQA